jgi:hypothetical protein
MKEGFKPKSFKNYNLTPSRTNQIGQIPQRKPQKRIHQTIPITYGITLLLCFKEG